MARGFETGSDNERIDELQKQLDDVLDSQISSVGGNEDISIDSSRGARNAASGDSGGVRSNEPIIHQITDIDEGGTPTGIFDKINIISSMAIIDHTSTPITLRFIQGTVKDGARIKITPKIGKTIDVESGGNILTSSTITITDGDYYELVKYSEAETGVTGGAFKIFLSGGGGGVSFPIDFPEEQRGTVGSSTEIIDFTQSDRHYVIMELNGDIGLSLINTTAGKGQISSIKLRQDGTGGHAFTGFSQAVGNEQVIIDAINDNNAPGDFTEFVVEFTDGLFTAYLKTGNIVTGGGTPFSGNLSDLVINVNKDWQTQGISNFGNLTGVTGIDFDGVATTIQGLSNLDFFQASHSINSLAGSMLFQVDTSDFLGFFAGGVAIAKFDDTTGLTIQGTHVINMGNNIINTISELQLSNANIHTPSNELSIAFDSADDALKFSVALTTDVHMFFANTDLLATFSRVGVNEGLLSVQAVTAAFLQAAETLFLSTFNNTSPTNGEIWRDSGDGKFKFRQNGITDELGSPSAIIDGNSSATILDAAPSFVVVLDGVQKYSISNTRVDYEELDLFGITQINMNDSGATLISSLSASATGLLLNILDPNDFYDIKFNSLDAFHVDELRTRILSTSPNLSSAKLSLFRDDPSPTIGDDLGVIQFDGRNSAAEFITYSALAGGITSITDGLETAVGVWNLMDGGLLVQQFRLEDGALRIRKFSSVASDVAALNLEKEDATPIANDSVAEINFNINDSGIITTYASISATIIDATDNAALTLSVRADNGLISAMVIQGDDNNQRFQTLMSGTSQARIQPIFDRMGYFVTPQVTDFSLVLGSGGSLESPQFNDGSPSLTDLNQAGGAFDGAIVHDTNDGTLYIRNNSGQWDFYTRSGTVT